MKVVLLKEKNFISYELFNIDGYKFKPKKNIKNLVIVNIDLIKKILTRKINKDINKASKTIKLMLDSNATIVSDCIMMENELSRLIKKIDKKYKKYFTEFEYFDLIKSIYELNMEINLKKKFLESE